MALGFLFPHNLCMWSSIMGSFIVKSGEFQPLCSTALCFGRWFLHRVWGFRKASLFPITF